MPISKLSLEERFWSHVNKDGPLCEALGTKCWVWVASISWNGYGNFHGVKKSCKAHRFSWELVNDPIPEGIKLLHKCDNPPCVNPDHLFLGTQRDNIQDAIKKNRLAKGESHGTHTHPESRTYGERNGFTKLTDDKVKEIRSLYLSGHSNKELRELFKVSHSTISEIVLGRRWKHCL